MQRQLCRPRVIKIPGCTDWARPEDIEYAREKHKLSGFDYGTAEAANESNLRQMEDMLTELGTMLRSDTALGEDGVLGWDDVLVLPELRTVSCVDELEWPARLHDYVTSLHAEANVATYFQPHSKARMATYFQ